MPDIAYDAIYTAVNKMGSINSFKGLLAWWKNKYCLKLLVYEKRTCRALWKHEVGNFMWVFLRQSPLKK